MKRAWILWAVGVLSALSVVATASAAEPEVAHYDLRGSLSPDGWFKAEAVITLPPGELGPETAFLLSRRFSIAEARADHGGRLRTQPVETPLPGLHRVILTFPSRPEGPVTLRIRYQGPLVAPGEAAGDGLELRLEDMWLPARSDLTLRFTARAVINGIPADQVVVAQGLVEHTGDRVSVVRDLADFDLPLVAVRGLKKVSTPGAEIYATDLDSRLIGIFVRHAPAVIAFHEALFGPIPGGGPVRIAVHERPGSGYARRGFISSTDPKASGDFAETNPAAFLAHEFAHAWWSAADPLTQDYWLVESLAEYSSLRYVEAAFGRTELDSALERKRGRAAKAGPILGGGRPSRDALYAKGCLLLFDLDRRIGREAMDAVLARLGRGPPRRTADFMTVLTKVAGAGAARDFEARLRR